ncbi:DinB family protein [Ilyomonas limi]|uniref:DinB family protein n=1 Tax=Ilyomonas limi TaxID=2575867 RepID=A0A4U3KQ01_9BACT|nr:DinB family protein [Ilyomonas limi]TKK64308.1 DinB family protein [Ilyomonas limi]
MKYLLIAVFASCIGVAHAQKDTAVSLKSILLEQLKTTHNVKDWFVPADSAIAGLTATQAMWKDSTVNHSIAQLTTHLIFWNEQILAKFKGEKPAAFDGNNNETFSGVTETTWPQTVQKLDSVLTEIENAVMAADENKLKSWYSTLYHIGTHNAYHTGQILYIRKMKGWWDDEKGVK